MFPLDWQVHIWNCPSVCADGTADFEENERDDWLGQRRGRRTLLTRLDNMQIEFVLLGDEGFSGTNLNVAVRGADFYPSLLNRGRYLQHVQCDDCTLQVFPRGQDQGDVSCSSPCPLHIWTCTTTHTHTILWITVFHLHSGGSVQA